MSSVLRYTVMRVMVFLGVLLVLWLVGLRGRDQLFLLLMLSLLISMIVSFFALRPFRDDMTRTISGKVDERAQRAEQRRQAEGFADEDE